MKKKLIITMIIFLAVLVIGSITLVLIDPFSGVNIKGERATSDQRKEFSELMENNLSDTFSYTFKAKSTTITKDKEKYQKEITKVKGKVTIDFVKSNSYNGMATSYSIEGRKSNIVKTGTLFGKDIKKEITSQSIIRINKYHIEAEESQWYIDSKYKYKENKNKTTSNFKSQLGYEAEIEPISVIELYYDIYKALYHLYVSKNKYTLVYNEDNRLTVIEVRYKDDKITKIIYNEEDANNNNKIIFKFTKYKTIKAPRNTDKYKPVD